MRDLTKSMMSYSWAMSLFGVQQMVNLVRPSQAAKSFDNVTDATQDEFDNILKTTFRVGDNIQRGLVDLTFSALTLGGALDPGRMTQAGSGMGQAAAQGGGQAASGGSCGSSECQPTGWGPMPTPDDAGAQRRKR